MAKIMITGAGSAQSNGVINCLKMDSEKNTIVGVGSDLYDLSLSKADKKILVPHSTAPNYKRVLLDVLAEEKPDMIHFQHDKELLIASEFMADITSNGVKSFIPDHKTIDTCVHKYLSWVRFKEAGIKVPNNIIIYDGNDLKTAFDELGPKIWLRSMEVGGGGLGALPTESIDEATEWIESRGGWGKFVAAELLSDKTVTWMSVWNEGELIAAQGRRRLSWAFGALSASGVTGVTRVCETVSDKVVDEIGIKACLAVSDKPHGVYGVDMTYDFEGVPNPTEINIGRFFTTVQFFAEAGLNMPVIIKNLCLYSQKPAGYPLLNPLEDGLLWIRGMDTPPVLTSKKSLEASILNKKE